MEMTGSRGHSQSTQPLKTVRRQRQPRTPRHVFVKTDSSGIIQAERESWRTNHDGMW